jgi:hypothetical protein
MYKFSINKYLLKNSRVGGNGPLPYDNFTIVNKGSLISFYPRAFEIYGPALDIGSVSSWTSKEECISRGGPTLCQQVANDTG